MLTLFPSHACTCFNCVLFSQPTLWSLRQAHVVESGLVPELWPFPPTPKMRLKLLDINLAGALPALGVDGFDVLLPSVVRVKYKPGNLASILIPGNTKDGVSIHTSPDHHWAALGLKVSDQLPCPAAKFRSRVDREKPGFCATRSLQHKPNLGGPDPLLAANELGFFITNVYKALLHLTMVRNICLSVTLKRKIYLKSLPRKYSLC